MAGKHITDRQVRRYMASRKEGYSQAAAAARSGFSERTGRRVGTDPVLPSQQDRTRRYRTRQDPFAEVWREEMVPMLQAMPGLRATTLLEELQRHHPGRYPDRLLRSLPSAVGFHRRRRARRDAAAQRQALRASSRLSSVSHAWRKHLAAMHGCEAAIADHLAAVLETGGTPDLEAARSAVVPPSPTAIPAVTVPAPDLAGYDALLRAPVLGEIA